MIFDGILKLYRLEDVSEQGLMPKQKLVEYDTAYYGERVVGFSRQYAAMAVHQQIDKLVRIWQLDEARINDYAIMEDGKQYRIDNVQHLRDADNLKVTDLTLSRLEKNYEVSAG